MVAGRMMGQNERCGGGGESERDGSREKAGSRTAF